MKTRTYRFYWYDMSSTYQKQDRILHTNMTWKMNTIEELDQYAVYKAKEIGAFKHEVYDERELLKGI
tara:strand:+ start:138 stop:338 length:201 start_codon:yes stop_codon:yes gene_type:complete